MFFLEEEKKDEKEKCKEKERQKKRIPIEGKEK